eukprot:Phypoly_transcript_24131.p1 GENE.Phypoly_transcript_24131~~Phypoly_transcript_24131.p1  ORF type:complete len:162 (+),score=12.41 Phypoly_transcript_24131:32-517(+)
MPTEVINSPHTMAPILNIEPPCNFFKGCLNLEYDISPIYSCHCCEFAQNKNSICLFQPYLHFTTPSTSPPSVFITYGSSFLTLNKVGTVPGGIRELMHYSFSIKRFDPTSWWMSEKYDGVQACWHYKDNKMYSWRGREYDNLHPGFISHLANLKVVLDGEI